MSAQIMDQLRGRRLTLGPLGVTVRCRCGFVIAYPNENLGCIECGEPCCPACGFVSEGAVYCAACAREVLRPVMVRQSPCKTPCSSSIFITCGTPPPPRGSRG